MNTFFSLDGPNGSPVSLDDWMNQPIRPPFKCHPIPQTSDSEVVRAHIQHIEDVAQREIRLQCSQYRISDEMKTLYNHAREILRRPPEKPDYPRDEYCDIEVSMYTTPEELEQIRRKITRDREEFAKQALAKYARAQKAYQEQLSEYEPKRRKAAEIVSKWQSQFSNCQAKIDEITRHMNHEISCCKEKLKTLQKASQVCRFYRLGEPDSCHAGAKCSFKHTDFASSIRGRLSSHVSSRERQDPTQFKTSQVCRFYRPGKPDSCHYGTRCHFQHIRPDTSSTQRTQRQGFPL